MTGHCTDINKRDVTFPQWLDTLVFEKLSARYCRQMSDMVVLKWKSEEIRTYLGTYFPRSYAESYCIFSKYLLQYRKHYEGLNTISVFDFGCGTGGELIGFIMAISEQLPKIRKINIRALDGNVHALRYLESILDKTQIELDLRLESHLMPIVIDDFYDMNVVTDVIGESYDFILSFKAVCEFATGQQFNRTNPYEHIINVFASKLSAKGIMCLADVTSYNTVSQDWLPVMLNDASAVCSVEVLCRNEGFNEIYRVTHSRHMNDVSKIAWRIYKKRN